ncbi:MAG TPA: PD-(D/E)XK nuclease family protein [Candidatus Deferrimicrobium sp.]|nr:PD-(D/E)XK nuclease family protein [Candidatus Deferrimicrobium sp.]
MSLPKEYISYSQIRLYQTCPKKFRFAYVDEIERPINDKVFLGTIFHAIVEYYLKEKISNKEPGKEELLTRFEEEFKECQKKQTVTWDVPEAETRKRGAAFIRHFLKEIAPEINPLMVEKELVVDLPGLNVKLKGIIDLVETDFSITDFKTTTAKWSKSRIKDSYLQMQIYRYIFEKCFGDVITHLRFRIIYAKGNTGIKDQKVSVKALDLDSTKMMDIINYVVENIRNGVFYKNENYTCSYCDFKELCRKESK